ncbi:MAG: penicillin-binding protein beta-lactamase class [Acidimicrobiales bacterium]|nr:penicillin-binding protein beta-lactamase class [Acidimicrobiales bacterium]
MFEQVADAARHSVEGGIPACQVAVALDGEVVLFEAFGDCTLESRFPISSATKPLVASAIWQLIGEGLLDVSKPVAHYVPEFATNGKDVVTVEQVMLHTAGFPQAPIRAVEGADPERRLARFASWRLDWEPGTRFEYHPAAAHWVLAELLERLRGADFRDVIADRVTTPLGLPRLLGLPEDEQAGYVEPVVADGEPWVVDGLSTPAARAAGVPGGGGIATAADLALFHQALLHDPKGLWDAAVLADAKTNVRCNLPDALLGVPVMRTLGLVLAGDDGKEQLRYAGFGKGVSPAAFGHMGAHFQLAWTDPATGVSFAYVNNLVADNLRQAMLTMPVANAAAE